MNMFCPFAQVDIRAMYRIESKSCRSRIRRRGARIGGLITSPIPKRSAGGPKSGTRPTRTIPTSGPDAMPTTRSGRSRTGNDTSRHGEGADRLSAPTQYALRGDGLPTTELGGGERRFCSGSCLKPRPRDAESAVRPRPRVWISTTAIPLRSPSPSARQSSARSGPRFFAMRLPSATFSARTAI